MTAAGVYHLASRSKTILLGIILLIILVWCGFIYYQYLYVVTTTAVQPQESIVLPDKKTLQIITDEVVRREATLQRIMAGSFRDPFKP